MTTIDIRVRYCDVDKMNVVYHAKYFDYMEWARTEFLRENKLTNKVIEEELKIGLPVHKVDGSYIKPARYDDELLVKVWLQEEPKGVRITLLYSIQLKGSEEVLFEGSSTHVCVDMDSMRPKRIPAEIQSLFVKEKL